MKKIAVACDNEIVSQHFGHCDHFSIFEVEDDKIINVEAKENPEHEPGFLPRYLSEFGVNAIIAGCMGKGAVEIFNEKGIDVITGASGKAEDAVLNYVKGELQTTGAVCSNHEHEHHHDHEHNHEHHHHCRHE